MPSYATGGSSGADLYSVDEVTIHPNQTAMISVGFEMGIPEGYEAQIRPRSGLAAKYGITVLNAPGTIDSDYRGPVKVLLINHGNARFDIRKGDRIAQMVIAKVERAHFSYTAALENTNRGEGGFGSTGRN
jgi:dUTP pyrophosphatase